MKLTLLADAVEDAFGKVSAPPALKKLAGTDDTGAMGINNFLSNLVTLIFSVSAVAVVIMLLWGAWDWIISGGEKEKVAGAQRRIINALIGLVLLSIVFAILKVFSIFTGFEIFKTPLPGFYPAVPNPPAGYCC